MFDGFLFWKSQSTRSTFGAFYRIEHSWIKKPLHGAHNVQYRIFGGQIIQKKDLFPRTYCTNVHILLSGIKHDVAGGILLYTSRYDDQRTYDDRWKKNLMLYSICNYLVFAKRLSWFWTYSSYTSMTGVESFFLLTSQS
jgi:hypothetical protein